MKTFYLKYNNTCGSKQHFYHFLHGYLLPALDKMLQVQNDFDNSSVRFILKSCGPIMDPIAQELLQLFNLNYIISQENDLIDKNNFKEIYVKSWDDFFRQYKLKLEANPNLKSNLNPIKSIKWHFYQKPFLKSIFQIRQIVLNKISESNKPNFPSCYYILKRSDQPEFYDQEKGLAEIPNYGSGRRFIANIEELAEFLRNKNIKFEFFTPGDHSLAEQIQRFSSCQGIISVRGAELSNIIWMKPGSKVVILDTKPFKSVSPCKALAHVIQVDFREIQTHQLKQIVLSKEIINTVYEQITD